MARHLGIEYLWIDSLCIVQDDRQDWKTESAGMADYYQRAWLTIASTTTTKEGGLFGIKLNPEDLPPVVRLPFRDRSGEQKGYFYVQAYEPSETENDYSKAVVNFNLRTRGWGFQEFKLSRRLLTFSKRGAYMMCRTKIPENLRGDTAVTQAVLFKMTDSLHHILYIWSNFMEQYCAFDFTEFEKDRLVALGGVAHEFKRALRCAVDITADEEIYFAYGHWIIPTAQKGTISGLFWQEAETEKDLGKYERVRAMGVPTWSWASMALRGRDNAGNITGLEVQWYSTKREYRDLKDEIVCGIKGFSAIPPEQIGSSYTMPDDDGAFFIPEPEYSNHSTLRVLELRGKVIQVSIHGYFPKDEDKNIATNLTYRLPKTAPARSTWRRVTTGGSFIIGWASLEHPEHHLPPCSSAQPPVSVYAFFARRPPTIIGGHGWGNWTNYQTAFEVLVLREFRGPQYYERIGMGRLFGNDIEGLYAAAEDADVFLI